MKKKTFKDALAALHKKLSDDRDRLDENLSFVRFVLGDDGSRYNYYAETEAWSDVFLHDLVEFKKELSKLAPTAKIREFAISIDKYNYIVLYYQRGNWKVETFSLDEKYRKELEAFLK